MPRLGYRKYECQSCRKTNYVGGVSVPDELCELLEYIARTMTTEEIKKLYVDLRLAAFRKIEPQLIEQFGEERAKAIEEEISKSS